MANGYQVDGVLRQIKLVDHPIVAHAQSKLRQSFKPVVWKLAQPGTDFRDFVFDLLLRADTQLKKDSVKLASVDFLVTHEFVQD